MLGIHGTYPERHNASELGVKGAWVLVEQIGVPHVGVAVMIEIFSAEPAFWDLAANILRFTEELTQFRRGVYIASKPVCTTNNGDRVFGSGLGRHDVLNRAHLTVAIDTITARALLP